MEAYEDGEGGEGGGQVSEAGVELGGVTRCHVGSVTEERRNWSSEFIDVEIELVSVCLYLANTLWLPSPALQAPSFAR